MSTSSDNSIQQRLLGALVVALIGYLVSIQISWLLIPQQVFFELQISRNDLLSPVLYLQLLVLLSSYYPVQALGALLPVGLSFMAASFLVFQSHGPASIRGFSKADNIHGSAEWAGNKELKEGKLLTGKGVVLGKDESGKRYLTHNGTEHFAIFAPSQSGKTTGIVIPTLMNWHGSLIVFDFKRELWDATAEYRSTLGPTYLFAPSSEFSCQFNPLLEVRKGPYEVRDAQNIAEMIVDPTGKGSSGGDNHWSLTGKAALTAGILHTLYASGGSQMSLPAMLSLLTHPGRSIEETLEMFKTTHHTNWGPHPVIAESAQEVINKAPNERSGVISTALSFLQMYRDPLIVRATSGSDFNISDFRTKDRPATLYIHVPDGDKDRLRPLIRLIINQITKRLAEEIDIPEGTLPLLLLMDEFYQLGRLEFFDTGSAALAGYLIRLGIILQDRAQILQLYGQNSSILPNCKIKVFHSPGELNTAEYLSKMCGNTTVTQKTHSRSGTFFSGMRSTVNVSRVARPLITSSEAQRLPNDEQIILLPGMNPIISKKIRWYQDKNFKELGSKNKPRFSIEKGWPWGKEGGAVNDWSQKSSSSYAEQVKESEQISRQMNSAVEKIKSDAQEENATSDIGQDDRCEGDFHGTTTRGSPAERLEKLRGTLER